MIAPHELPAATIWLSLYAAFVCHVPAASTTDFFNLPMMPNRLKYVADPSPSRAIWSSFLSIAQRMFPTHTSPKLMADDASCFLVMVARMSTENGVSRT